MNKLEIVAQNGNARAGLLHTHNGTIETPFFMVVGTRAAVKGGVSSEDLKSVGTQVLLCNTYHLTLRPGEQIIETLGGLHSFSNWDKPILTDSGGYQVYSLRDKKITDDGVLFKSHIDGAQLMLSPEKSIQIQHSLGANMIMNFDDCPPNIPDRGRILKAVNRTTAWAKRCRDFHDKSTSNALLFGIVQGGCFQDLREKSLQELQDIGFEGYALGGLAVGEPEESMYAVLDMMVHKLPDDKPKYLMGVGTPTNLLQAMLRGIDMFDCVLPMRNARHGVAYTWDGALRISNAAYKQDGQTIDQRVTSLASGYSRAYVRHLLKVGEGLGQRLITIHNIAFYMQLMRASRAHIKAGTFTKWAPKLIKKWAKA